MAKFTHVVNVKNNPSEERSGALISESFEVSDKEAAKTIVEETNAKLIELGLFKYFESCLISLDENDSPVGIILNQSFFNLKNGYMYISAVKEESGDRSQSESEVEWEVDPREIGPDAATSSLVWPRTSEE